MTDSTSTTNPPNGTTAAKPRATCSPFNDIDGPLHRARLAARALAHTIHGMDEADFARPLLHPQHGTIVLDWMLQLYAWHGRHHAAHITALRRREGW